MAFLLTLVVLSVRSRQKVFLIYSSVFLSFAIIAIYQLLRLFIGPEFLSFGIFRTTTSNLVGSWSDLAIFSGLIAIFSLITLTSLSFSASRKIALYVALVVSLFFLALVNFVSAWWIVGLFSLSIFVYSFVNRRLSKRLNAGGTEGEATEKSARNISFASLIVLVIAGVFIISSTTANRELQQNANADNRGIHTYLSDTFSITQIEARPNWQTTVNIGKQTLSEQALLGSGPNTFVKQWLLYKPVAVNHSIFWNIDFNAGVGTIPTSFITTGMLGGFAWIVFLGTILIAGMRFLLKKDDTDQLTNYISLSSLFMAVYLWILHVIYTPSVVLTTLAFVITAIFILSLRFRTEQFKFSQELSFVDNPRTGFVTVLLMTVIFLAGILGIFTAGQKYTAAVYFQKALREANVNGDIDKAEAELRRDQSLDSSDRFNRLAVDIGLARLGQIFSDTSTPVDTLRDQFTNTFNRTRQNAEVGISIDEDNYQNWAYLEKVYRYIVPLQIEGAYEKALNAYEKAVSLSPQGPAVELNRARLEIANNNLEQAKEYIAKALEKKMNYTDAIFLLSQIQINEGNIDQAINSVESAILIDQNNPVAFFQLGILKYSQENNAGAIAALEEAINRNKDYSNARYFLGLSYNRIGRVSDAILQFEEIESG